MNFNLELWLMKSKTIQSLACSNVASSCSHGYDYLIMCSTLHYVQLCHAFAKCVWHNKDIRVNTCISNNFIHVLLYEILKLLVILAKGKNVHAGRLRINC